VHTIFTKRLLAEPKIRSTRYQYGFLAIILALLLLQVLILHHSEPYRPSRNFGCIACVIALLYHLAYQFRWSQQVTVALRVAAMVFSNLGLAYVVIIIGTE
jgi:hypothetical protein